MANEPDPRIRGFLDFERQDMGYEKPEVRRANWKEFMLVVDEGELKKQATRCMDCGIPFCHMPREKEKSGCPVENNIPDFNNLIRTGRWEVASTVLYSTNNFPDVTGRICPAPCEAACVLNIDNNSVAIKQGERAISDRAWGEKWVKPLVPTHKSGKKVAVVGSGPAGMAAAQQLARAGHSVELFEKNAKIGGLLRYGIPDFKMEKHIIDRNLAIMAAEGVVFRCNINVGVDVTVDDLLKDYDAVALTGGAEVPREIPVSGRDLNGIHFAMEYLPQQNKRIGGETLNGAADILATDKNVLVIGGGDTGSDCIGTAWRQGALSVTQLEILAEPPEFIERFGVWPDWPNEKRTTSSHLEGETVRIFAVDTKSFFGASGVVQGLNCIKVENFKPVAGTEFPINADLVLIAAGFTGSTRPGLLDGLGVEMDPRRGNVTAKFKLNYEGKLVPRPYNYLTSHPSGKVFVAGDMRRGQSLVVWAIREGRQAAQAINDCFVASDENWRKTSGADPHRLARWMQPEL